MAKHNKRKEVSRIEKTIIVNYVKCSECVKKDNSVNGDLARLKKLNRVLLITVTASFFYIFINETGIMKLLIKNWDILEPIDAIINRLFQFALFIVATFAYLIKKKY